MLFQQILDMQFAGPLTQIGQVQSVGLHLENAQDVLPLIFRDFTSRAEPLEL